MAEKTSESAVRRVYAVVRLKGSVGEKPVIFKTMEKLRLKAVNNCVLVPATPSYEGMLKRASSCITWGPINSEMLVMLLEKRGVPESGKKLDAKQAKEIAQKIMKDGSLEGSGVDSLFRLSPPSKGLKTIKLYYPMGALGFMGDEINGLLERMI